MSPPRKRRYALFSPQGAKKLLGRPGEFLERYERHIAPLSGNAASE
jgi:hypothetical protein